MCQETQQLQCLYKIPCKDCTSIYIGETHDINIRQYQHKQDLINNTENSSLTYHRTINNHRININATTPIHYIKHINKRKIAESVYIKNIQNFNKIQGDYRLDYIQNSLLLTDSLFKNIDSSTNQIQ